MGRSISLACARCVSHPPCVSTAASRPTSALINRATNWNCRPSTDGTKSGCSCGGIDAATTIDRPAAKVASVLRPTAASGFGPGAYRRAKAVMNPGFQSNGSSSRKSSSESNARAPATPRRTSGTVGPRLIARSGLPDGIGLRGQMAAEPAILGTGRSAGLFQQPHGVEMRQQRLRRSAGMHHRQQAALVKSHQRTEVRVQAEKVVEPRRFAMIGDRGVERRSLPRVMPGRPKEESRTAHPSPRAAARSPARRRPGLPADGKPAAPRRSMIARTWVVRR